MPDIENRIKAGQVHALFGSTVEEIKEETIVVKTPAGIQELKNDFTFVLVGFHPDTDTFKRYRIEINADTLAPYYDKRTFETNVPGLYVAGSVVAGKNCSKVFIESGSV